MTGRLHATRAARLTAYTATAVMFLIWMSVAGISMKVPFMQILWSTGRLRDHLRRSHGCGRMDSDTVARCVSIPGIDGKSDRKALNGRTYFLSKMRR